MRFHVGPVVEAGGLEESVFIWTPRGRASRRNVDVFIRELASTLTRRENVGETICGISVLLQDLGELGPASYFLEALCNFLREHAFAVAGDRTQANPLQLKAQVLDEVVEDVEQSDSVVREVISRICRAIWENERIRTANVVHLDLPAAPNREALDLFLSGRTSNTTASDSPSVTIRVRPRAEEPGNERDVLGLDVAGLRFAAESSHHSAAVADVVLGSSFSEAEAGVNLNVMLFSAGSAAAFAASLRRNRHHGFPVLNIAKADPSEFAIVDATGDADPARPTDVDTADLCRAVLRCPAVDALAFLGLNFSAAAVDAAREATSDPDPTAKLSKLTFARCTYSDPIHGFSSLAAAMSPSNTLQLLALAGTPLQMNDMAALCSILARSEWPLLTLVLGDAINGDKEPCLSDACVQHFFQMLPSIKALSGLKFSCSVPTQLSRTVVDGIKYNYWITQVVGLTFAVDSESTARLQSEAEFYATANLYGRTAVHVAVTSPGNRPLREIALAVLHRLSNSDDIGNFTTLYLCLQLFLPFCCGDLGIVALGPGGAAGDARALSRGDRPR
jgi:hypothetical protein